MSISVLKNVLICWFCVNAFGRLAGQDGRAEGLDPSPISQAVAAYADAFNRRDPEALAQLWSENAVYTNRITGESISGRDTIRDHFQSMFSEQGQPTRMDLTSESIQFLSPSVAVEHGVAEMAVAEGESQVYAYTAIYVWQGGKWLLDRVTDEEIDIQPFREGLESLAWLVGDWEHRGDEIQISLECHWTNKESFLVRSFVIASQEGEFSGTQIIGWDPSVNAPRSWTFDDGGAFVEGKWSVEQDRWTLFHHGLLADGTKSAMVNVMSKLDEDTFTWKTIDRIAGDELLPDLPALTFTRTVKRQQP